MQKNIRQSKHLPIDITNDKEMVELGIRQPLVQVLSFSKTNEDKLEIRKHKQLYKKLKSNIIMYKETLNYILKAFLENQGKNLPKYNMDFK